MELRIVTPHSPEECRRRLSDLAPARPIIEYLFVPAGEVRIFGRLQGSRLRVLPVIGNLRSALRPTFHGAIRAHASGAAIEGRFRIRRFVIAFLALWALGFLVASTLLWVRWSSDPAAGVIALVFVVVIVMLVGAVFAGGMVVSEMEAQHVSAFLCERLDGTPLAPEAGAASSPPTHE